MLVFVSVLCVLCVFVVKPSSVAVLHRSHRALWVSFIPHRSHRVAARKSTTPCINQARYSINVRHQYRALSRLHTISISVSHAPQHDMHIFDVNKCTYLYRQLPPSPLSPPHKNNSNLGNAGIHTTTPVVRHLRPPSFVLRPSSFVLRPPSTVHRPPSSHAASLLLHLLGRLRCCLSYCKMHN